MLRATRASLLGLRWALGALLVCFGILVTSPAAASSHREAPTTLEMPQLDGADFYLFRSYEAGREGFVTLVADYNPLQDPFGAPHYFPLRENAVYDIHVDHDGDAVEDLTFRFRFFNALPRGGEGLVVQPPNQPGSFVPVGVSNVFPAGPGSPAAGTGNPVAPPDDERVNWLRSYTLHLLRGPVSQPTEIIDLGDPLTRGRSFPMPFDYVGTRAFPDYAAYADAFKFSINIPGCGEGRVFVGQRKDPFVTNLGDFFDLTHLPDITGDPAAATSSLANRNVTSLALEVPTSCLTTGGNGSGIIGGWTTARLPRHRALVNDPTFDQPYLESGDLVQVSRLGNPLVNQLVIGHSNKDRFNASEPLGDSLFQLFFTHPTLPVLIRRFSALYTPELVLLQPTNIPRQDLVTFYLAGLPGINHDGSGGEVLRLNVNTPPKPAAQQNRLGVLGGDDAGWPNGRRPGDDVVDVTLRVLMGALCHQGFGLCTPDDALCGALPLTDQAFVQATELDDAWPYLLKPVPGGSSAAP
jgi:hypothetical protein